MASLNFRSQLYIGKTHEGAPAKRIGPLQELRRSVLSCLLWEDSFYEKGNKIAQRIADLVPTVSPTNVAQLAIEARNDMHLRHVPLFLAVQMAKHKEHRAEVRRVLREVIQRPDELTEVLAILWPGGDRKKAKDKLPRSFVKGLAEAFPKFSAYQLAKYNRDNPVKLRDALFLSHAKPKSAEQAQTWKQLIDGTLPAPDTWEVQLSAGADKRATWERLIAEQKLGGMALIRNLRNMVEAGVKDATIRDALTNIKADNILPFRFVAAANIMPQFTEELGTAMLRNLEGQKKILGTTIVLVDVSGSMRNKISAKSDLQRTDAACGLAVFAREICQYARVFSFSDKLVEVPNIRGLALVPAIQGSQRNANTHLGRAVEELNKRFDYDRLIVITDEQSADEVPGPKGKGYMINIATDQKGVGYGPWIHIDGWSDKVLDYIRATEEESL